MPHKQQVPEQKNPEPLKLTPADIERQERNRRKAASKIKLTIIPLPGREGNPKKNPKLRRPRGKIAPYIPYVLLNLHEFQTVHYPKRKKQNPQLAINNDLFKRAQIARRQGGYHRFQKLNRGL